MRKIVDLERRIKRVESALVLLSMAAIASGDHLFGPRVSLGYLYLIPLSYSALTHRWPITVCLLVVCEPSASSATNWCGRWRWRRRSRGTSSTSTSPPSVSSTWWRGWRRPGSWEVAFAPGDLFVFYSDGITDAENADGADLGSEEGP